MTQRTFQLVDFSAMTEKEYKAKYRFEHTHKKCRRETATGGQFTYHITPTSIGSIVVVECNVCKKKKDVTEYGAW